MNNQSIGNLMIWASGFVAALNLYELLPHVGGVNATWGKVIFAVAVGVCGWYWSTNK